LRHFGLAGLLGAAGLASVSAMSCGSSGNVASGGTCYLATDCAPGLYCFGVTATMAGMCTNNAQKAQPDASAYVDGGKLPMTDAPGSDAPVGEGAPPTDTGTPDTTPPADTGPADTGPPPPTDSGGA
jgi:hypothetical protein